MKNTGFSVEVECWGDSPTELSNMALREAQKYFKVSMDYLAVAPFQASPQFRNGDGSVISWVADVRVCLMSKE